MTSWSAVADGYQNGRLTIWTRSPMSIPARADMMAATSGRAGWTMICGYRSPATMPRFSRCAARATSCAAVSASTRGVFLYLPIPAGGSAGDHRPAGVDFGDLRSFVPVDDDMIPGDLVVYHGCQVAGQVCCGVVEGDGDLVDEPDPGPVLEAERVLCLFEDALFQVPDLIKERLVFFPRLRAHPR